VALIFDYDADAAWATQPHGAGLSYFGLVFEVYKSVRRLGLSIDILPPTTRDFSGYKLVAAPGVMHMPDDLKSALTTSEAEIVIGPRSAARDADMRIPVPLPPAIDGLDVTVARVESLRPDMPIDLAKTGQVTGYREVLEGRAETILQTAKGVPVAMRSANVTYLGGWLDTLAFDAFFEGICQTADLETLNLPTGLRRREAGDATYWFNYSTQKHSIQGLEIEPISVVRIPHD